jgi:hypothetical protein
MVSFGALIVVSKTINFFIKKTESEGVGFVSLSIVFSFWQEMINTVNATKIVMYFFIVNLFKVCFMATNGLRAGDRNPVLRLRQGYGACALL